MDPARLADIKLKHVQWLRGEDGGARANLYGADLSGANLYGADLSGANLSGEKVVGLVLSGVARSYDWILAEREDGLFLKFGCEAKPWAVWDLEATCERHEPGRGFPATIRAIVALHAACKEPEAALDV